MVCFVRPIYLDWKQILWFIYMVLGVAMSHCVIAMAKLSRQIGWKWGVQEIEAEPWLTLNFYPELLYLCPIPESPLISYCRPE